MASEKCASNERLQPGRSDAQHRETSGPGSWLVQNILSGFSSFKKHREPHESSALQTWMCQWRRLTRFC
ncbi:hypothetical protein EYF80_023570 [Liparis tanakae]|uniref:Uncharacterized protein n=1 Tax=Liparis tanakae TaxID=230148 RepID=A0A4Z2HKW2_9TELE|nr:hypothetical protein EYF80_023570 [Liparis tanakae]